MKMFKVPTLRNGYPCTALEIDVDLVQKLAAAYRAGVKVRIRYTDLAGVTVEREAYVEDLYSNLFYTVIKHRDFGYRTVFFERIHSVVC